MWTFHTFIFLSHEQVHRKWPLKLKQQSEIVLSWALKQRWGACWHTIPGHPRAPPTGGGVLDGEGMSPPKENSLESSKREMKSQLHWESTGRDCFLIQAGGHTGEVAQCLGVLAALAKDRRGFNRQHPHGGTKLHFQRT